MQRRTFLRTLATAAGTAAGTAAVTQSTFAQQPPAGAAPASPMAPEKPALKNSKPYFKLSLAAYSYRDALTAKPPTMSLDDFIRQCAEFDLDGTELTSYYFPKDFSPDYLQHVKQLAFRLGLDISGTAIGNDFCVIDTAAIAKEIQHTRNWIDNAAAMGAPVMRIFAGSVPAGDTPAASVERCASNINQLLPYAAEKGVILALENHGGITARPVDMLEIVHRVNPSPWFGVNLDTGNFHSDDPYRDLAMIAPYAVNVQVKTEVSISGQKQPCDLPRVIEILRAAAYRGYVVLEYEAPEPFATAIPKHLATLKQLIRS